MNWPGTCRERAVHLTHAASGPEWSVHAEFGLKLELTATSPLLRLALLVLFSSFYLCRVHIGIRIGWRKLVALVILSYRLSVIEKPLARSRNPERNPRGVSNSL